MYISGVNQDLCPHAAHNESRLGVQALRVSILWERVASAQGARAPSDHAGAQRVPWEQSPVWDDGRDLLSALSRIVYWRTIGIRAFAVRISAPALPSLFRDALISRTCKVRRAICCCCLRISDCCSFVASISSAVRRL